MVFGKWDFTPERKNEVKPGPLSEMYGYSCRNQADKYLMEQDKTNSDRSGRDRAVVRERLYRSLNNSGSSSEPRRTSGQQRRSSSLRNVHAPKDDVASPRTPSRMNHKQFALGFDRRSNFTRNEEMGGYNPAGSPLAASASAAASTNFAMKKTDAAFHSLGSSTSRDTGLRRDSSPQMPDIRKERSSSAAESLHFLNLMRTSTRSSILPATLARTPATSVRATDPKSGTPKPRSFLQDILALKDTPSSSAETSAKPGEQPPAVSSSAVARSPLKAKVDDETLEALAEEEREQRELEQLMEEEYEQAKALAETQTSRAKTRWLSAKGSLSVARLFCKGISENVETTFTNNLRAIDQSKLESKRERARLYSEKVDKSIHRKKTMKRDDGTLLDMKDVINLKKYFDSLDVNHNGIVETEEITQAMESKLTKSGRSPMAANLEKFFMEAVTARHGISFLDLLRILHPRIEDKRIKRLVEIIDPPAPVKRAVPYTKEQEEEFDEMWRSWDTDGSGTLDQGEFRDVLHTLGNLAENMDEEEMLQLFNRIDRVGKGHIDERDMKIWWFSSKTFKVEKGK
ncbi:hypothetical protein CYMTET_11801 [Cymbomonas tetramitiformis]|uniref:EF-hand domain-containing protein n=1 Tax=Cymbomonas tetramitiformis TaxID=36881 RepID=A0AAE0GLK1_9CHLO|nr:hypothetical protein CYMTET_11801 [Cymbomonas tetramitiformis]